MYSVHPFVYEGFVQWIIPFFKKRANGTGIGRTHQTRALLPAVHLGSIVEVGNLTRLSSRIVCLVWASLLVVRVAMRRRRE